MRIPDPYEFILLGLAAWSVFHLLAHDDIVERPRRYILRLGKDWEKDGDPVPDDYRLKWAQFLTCPYCAGFWIWVAWLVAFWIWPAGVLPVAVLFGGRAMVVGGQKIFGKAEDKAASPDAELVVDGLTAIALATKAAGKQAVRSRS